MRLTRTILAGVLAACLGASLGGALLAQDAPSRDILPLPETLFAGTIAEHVADAQPFAIGNVRAPDGAPNIFLFMADDVGFAMASTFGGPVPTPNFDRLAARGVRYNNFHTTGICSPSRAALLTGRNHHNAGVGYLSDLPNGFPGYGGRILRSTASIAQVLTLNGYSTAMFGKHHNVPTSERSEAGPFDAWPTGIGFEYFYGFVGGDTDQFAPRLYRGAQRASEAEDNGDLLDKRLADDLIRWVHNQQAGNPDKPFFAYLAPGSTHAPHQAPPEYIARFRGAFDGGWDAVRRQTYQRQIAGGIIPRTAVLTERPEEIPAWTSLTEGQRAFAARAMEVAAAQLVYQDEQVGRIIAELERMGEWDNTLFIVIGGDNGASAEAGPRGTLNEMRTMGTHDEREDFLTASIDQLGGPQTYQSYPAGWSWAMNAPFRWHKQFASMLGGIRNGAIMGWGDHVDVPGAVCERFGHLVDIVPTILEASRLPAPRMVLGTEQKPMDGESLLASLDDCAPDVGRTQYFEVGGKIGLYHDGWFLSGDDGRLSWEDIGPGGERPEIAWSLYNLREDFSQSRDLADQEPARLAALQALWREEAAANNVWPLDHRFARARGAALQRAAMMASGGAVRREFDLWGNDVSLPANVQPILMGRSFTLQADLALVGDAPSGVVVALGSRFGGWSLYLDEGRPVFVWARSTDPAEIVMARAEQAVTADTRGLTLRFATSRPGAAAVVTVLAGEVEVLRAEVPVNVLVPAGGGETLDVGRDLGVPVADYHVPDGRIDGAVPHVRVTFD